MHTCRYGPHPGDSFRDWRGLVIHEAGAHPEIHSRIPCPADGCTKHYAQLKYLITHYNIHSGKLTHCPTCHKGYTDPSRASRCRQSHDRHFMCPSRPCGYSNARADLVKQHCKKKHPELGELTTNQLDSTAYPMSEAQSMSDVSFTFQTRSNSDGSFDSEERPAPQLSRPALAQAAESRRVHNINGLRQTHIVLSGLSPDQFDAAVPDYPFKGTPLSYVQGSGEDTYSGQYPGSSSSGPASGPTTPNHTGMGPYYAAPAPDVAPWFSADLSASPIISFIPRMEDSSTLAQPMSNPSQHIPQPSDTSSSFPPLQPATYPYAPPAGMWDMSQGMGLQFQDIGALGATSGYPAHPVAYLGSRPWSSESGPSMGAPRSGYSSLSNFQGQSRHHRDYSA